uniref:Uncharacterized protein n=1 Tax=Amphimedon queenslandica TaxID=400682 RepID=A0A1X7VE86_AMPQE
MQLYAEKQTTRSLALENCVWLLPQPKIDHEKFNNLLLLRCI